MRLALALVLLLAWPASALAHVTVLPTLSRPGETADLTFRVPNERDDAATVRLDLFLPRGVKAEIPARKGWTLARQPTGEVRWTADSPASAILPGRTQDFKVRLGPLPDQPQIVFKALQHYADGQVVRWIQDPGSEERPAAVLDLGGGTAADNLDRGDDSNSWAVIAGAIVIAFAAGGLLVAVTRRRRDDI